LGIVKARYAYLVLPATDICLVIIFSSIFDKTSNTKLITIQADKDATPIARPMEVEQGRFANVTHFSNTSHSRLPRDALIFRLLIGMQCKTLSFLSHHVTKLIADQTQNKFRFGNVVMWRCIGSRSPQHDVVLRCAFARVFCWVKVPCN
jgi:hypothetical protein